MKNFNIEKFKTLLLAILFTLSIALNQQLWEKISLDKITPSVKDTEVVNMNNINHSDNISDILSPQSFTINFGGGLHTVLHSDSYNMWNEVVKIFKKSYFLESSSIEKINKEKWIELQKFRSIEMQFGYSMSPQLLSNITQQKKLGIYEKIEGFDKILISLMDESCIYLADEKRNAYYVVRGTPKVENFSKVIKNIEQGNYEAYYALTDIYGINNNTLMPIEGGEDLHNIEVVKEIDSLSEEQVEAFAGTFFGENLDFVRKIRETNGSVIYMYGYGQKALKIDHMGRLQYVEKIDEGKASKSMKLDEATQIAISFVREHGDMEGINGYLKEIKTFEEKNQKGYVFLFGYGLNNLPVYYHDEGKIIDAPIEVKVLGEQVISYKRFIKREKVAMKFLGDKEQNHILSSPQIIDMNFPMIQKDYAKINQEVSQKNITDQVLEKVKSIEIGYYDDSNKQPNELSLIWIIKIDKIVYYFDAATGKLLWHSSL
ncbi:hypothetical protein [Inediibacterium massiliense]|uniref:hypothetical protein n=1 Tax=Inediibacterium massiliense TaxID=1658111 RepID=UPI0006B430CD|nr:hypothetical protein [Inediibacterium massiliense]